MSSRSIVNGRRYSRLESELEGVKSDRDKKIKEAEDRERAYLLQVQQLTSDKRHCEERLRSYEQKVKAAEGELTAANDG